MPPKTIMTREEVAMSIANSFGEPCAMKSHRVDALGDCHCGTYNKGRFDWTAWINHLLSFAPEEEEDESDVQPEPASED